MIILVYRQIAQCNWAPKWLCKMYGRQKNRVVDAHGFFVSLQISDYLWVATMVPDVPVKVNVPAASIDHIWVFDNCFKNRCS